MKAFLEYIPLVFFLLIYKLKERVVQVAGFEFTIGGIYSATAVLMIGTLLVYGAVLAKQRHLTRLQWLVVVAVMAFGSATLLLRSEAILKWKAPVVNWIMAIVFLGSQFFRETNMAKVMFGELVTMPDAKWRKLNLAWAGVFFFVGSANLFVAFTFPAWWVDFKLFGSLGLLLLASVAQIFYIYPHFEQKESVANDDNSKLNSGK
ncbi:MAG TPA: inner membrane-spanning protein YciB [Candidatus Acidoferrum sp.]|nr:inner membrane-spanning protein YciB [Candidatus Acidoferrum sp.]